MKTNKYLLTFAQIRIAALIVLISYVLVYIWSGKILLYDGVWHIFWPIYNLEPSIYHLNRYTQLLLQLPLIFLSKIGLGNYLRENAVQIASLPLMGLMIVAYLFAFKKSKEVNFRYDYVILLSLGWLAIPGMEFGYNYANQSLYFCIFLFFSFEMISREVYRMIAVLICCFVIIWGYETVLIPLLLLTIRTLWLATNERKYYGYFIIFASSSCVVAYNIKLFFETTPKVTGIPFDFLDPHNILLLCLSFIFIVFYLYRTVSHNHLKYSASLFVLMVTTIYAYMMFFISAEEYSALMSSFRLWILPLSSVLYLMIAYLNKRLMKENGLLEANLSLVVLIFAILLGTKSSLSYKRFLNKFQGKGFVAQEFGCINLSTEEFQRISNYAEPDKVMYFDILVNGSSNPKRMLFHESYNENRPQCILKDGGKVYILENDRYVYFMDSEREVGEINLTFLKQHIRRTVNVKESM